MIVQPPPPKKNRKEKRRNCRIVDFAVPTDHSVKLKEFEKRDKYLDHVRELKKKTIKHEDDGDAKSNRYTWINP